MLTEDSSSEPGLAWWQYVTNERRLLELCSGVGVVLVEFWICTSTSTNDPFYKILVT